MTTETALGLILTGIVAGAGVVFGVPRMRSEWFSGTRSLVDLQAKTIESLEEKVKELTHELKDLRNHLITLERSYAASLVCTRAVNCKNYVPPTARREEGM